MIFSKSQSLFEKKKKKKKKKKEKKLTGRWISMALKGRAVMGHADLSVRWLQSLKSEKSSGSIIEWRKVILGASGKRVKIRVA